MLMLNNYVPLYSHGLWENTNKNSHPWDQDFLVPDDFQNVMSTLVQDMEYVKTYLDDLLILTNQITASKNIYLS
jgi:hypothetical protein